MMGKKTSTAEKRPRQKRETRPPKDPSLRNKMYKYRLYPTKDQMSKLEWILRRCKELYNAALEERTEAYRMAGISVTFKRQSEQLPEIKEDRPEYQEIYSQVLQEDLQIKNMSATPKPKKDEGTENFLPNGAAAKGGLNKSILDAAWGTFTRLCVSKAEEAGCTVVKVSPRNTTQACSGCGSLVPKDLTVRWHSCPDCGCELDRDENAALNILSRYQRPETPLVVVKGEKKPRKTKKSPGAGSVPQPLGEEPASPDDCRSHRLSSGGASHA